MTAELFAGEIAPHLVEALDALLCATRAESIAAGVLEHRAAALWALLSKGGPRYLSRATSELDDAINTVEDASEARRHAATRAASALGLSRDARLSEFASVAPSPYGSALLALRADLLMLRERLVNIAESNTTELGQRIALVSEALSSVGDDSSATYGRPMPNAARLVRGVL
jgi:hypothetical protein